MHPSAARLGPPGPHVQARRRPRCRRGPRLRGRAAVHPREGDARAAGGATAPVQRGQQTATRPRLRRAPRRRGGVGVVPALWTLAEPADPRRLGRGDAVADRQGRPARPSADDLLRPALRPGLQVELPDRGRQAGDAREPDRRARRRQRAAAGVPRLLPQRHPLLPRRHPRASCPGKGAPHRERLAVRADRRQERPPLGPSPRRGLRPREPSSHHHLAPNRRLLGPNPARERLVSPVVREGQVPVQVSTALRTARPQRHRRPIRGILDTDGPRCRWP